MNEMVAEAFLRGRRPRARALVEWGRAGIELDISAHLSTDLPPAGLLTSVRAVVQHQGLIVVLENPDGKHYLPGGRIEPGETHVEALVREVAEECGLRLIDPRQIGFLHFRHLSPRPDDYPYPFPDMMHLILAAEGEGTLSSGDTDGYEFGAELMPAEAAAALHGTGFALPFLERAMQGQ